MLAPMFVVFHCSVVYRFLYVSVAAAVDKSLPGVEEMHNPYGKILFREFTNYLVTLAFHIYQSQHE